MKRQRRRFTREAPYSSARARLNRHSVVGMGYYKLDKHGRTVECRSLGEWARTYGRFIARSVARTVCDDLGFVVSTVFLGVDHNFGFRSIPDSPPALFETMIHRITAGDFLDYQTRYATRAEALAGHEVALAWLKARVILIASEAK